MPSPPVCTVEVTLQPSDQRLASLLEVSPEDVQYYIISAFATLSFENLKCVSSLNSRYYASFHSRLYHSITLSNENVYYLRQLCIPPLQSGELPVVVANQQRHLERYINQYNRFRSICSSTRTLSVVGEKIFEMIAQISQQEGNTNLFSKVEQLVLRDMKTNHNPRRINIDPPLKQSLGTIFTTIQPRKLCLNLGIPFSHTWRNLVQKLAEEDLSGLEEIVYHGVPISNLEIEVLILEDVAIQRFFLEDYIIPSYCQTTLKIVYRWASPRNTPHSHRRTPQEIHVHAHWRGSFGLPLELVDSPIEGMWELKKVTHIHQADEKVESLEVS
ncbi:hypothetical protein L486_01967 [Kwoniella mangroviensis CBS 10435]|uniref:F-box domain-containing protein n=1 Tax=Kwoniella mangroviensis CBS 10435 TaxID=1331196 RepID=A0A1B9J3H0_9TREE|nr:hypothetical protein L486_01967 [Kwoniella mangroviensis CBS 10435]